MKLVPKQKEKVDEKVEPKKIDEPEISRAENQAQSESKLKSLRKSEPSIRKIIRKAAVLADLITEQDLQDDARVIRDATLANLHVYDAEEKKLIEKPDHKTRLAATTLRRAYHEGTPIKRQITLTGNFQSAEDLLARLQTSPEALKAITGAGIEITFEGQIIEVDSEIKS